MNDIYVKPPVNDQLAYILQWGVDFSEHEHRRQVEKLQTRVARLIAQEVVRHAFVRQSQYRILFSIPFDEKRSALIQLGARNPHKQKGGVRVSFNPARMDDQDTAKMHRIMRKILGREVYNTLMLTPLINVLHPAVDVYGVSLDRTLVHYGHVQQRTTFGKRTNKAGAVEGYNYGGISSDYAAAVYDKRVERVHRAVENIARAGRLGNTSLKSAAVKQFHDAREHRPFIRVEVRGKKMRGLPLYKIASMTNRFKRFSFTDLDAMPPELPAALQQACISIYRDLGAAAVFETFDGTKHLPAIKRWLSTGNADWWQPDALWQGVDTALRASKIFPPAAFLDPDLRNAAPHPAQASKSKISTNRPAVPPKSKKPR